MRCACPLREWRRIADQYHVPLHTGVRRCLSWTRLLIFSKWVSEIQGRAPTLGTIVTIKYHYVHIRVLKLKVQGHQANILPLKSWISSGINLLLRPETQDWKIVMLTPRLSSAPSQLNSLQALIITLMMPGSLRSHISKAKYGSPWHIRPHVTRDVM